MATCLAVITRALRMINATDVGVELSSEEAATGLEALQGLYLLLINQGTLGALADVYTAINYTAKENERVSTDPAGTITVTLPDRITDTYTSIVRPVRDLSVVVVTGSTPYTYVYDGYAGVWVRIEGLTLTSDAPFSGMLSAGLSALLALHILSEYRDAPAPPTVALQAAMAMSALTQRPASVRAPVNVDYF